MGDLKKWHIALFVLAIAGIGFLLWWSMGSGGLPAMKHRVYLIDVTNGQVFEMSTKRKPALIPERNPDSQQRTLFPAKRAEDGTWVLETRYLSALDNLSVKPEAVVNAETGEVRAADGSPRQLN